MGRYWNWMFDNVHTPKLCTLSNCGIPDKQVPGSPRNDIALAILPQIVNGVCRREMDCEQNETGTIYFTVTNDGGADYGPSFVRMLSGQEANSLNVECPASGV